MRCDLVKIKKNERITIRKKDADKSTRSDATTPENQFVAWNEVERAGFWYKSWAGPKIGVGPSKNCPRAGDRRETVLIDSWLPPRSADAKYIFNNQIDKLDREILQ